MSSLLQKSLLKNYTVIQTIIIIQFKYQFINLLIHHYCVYILSSPILA